MTQSDGPCKSTDREIWRGPDEGSGAFYADSLHVTKEDALGINCGGTVIVKPIREWHRLAIIAWRYELAHCGWDKESYGHWNWHLSESEPHVPEGSIRNLTPLYAAPPHPAPGYFRVLEQSTGASETTWDIEGEFVAQEFADQAFVRDQRIYEVWDHKGGVVYRIPEEQPAPDAICSTFCTQSGESHCASIRVFERCPQCPFRLGVGSEPARSFVPAPDAMRDALDKEVSDRLLAMADALKSGELTLTWCHPRGLGAIDANNEQIELVEKFLREAALSAPVPASK